MLPIGNQPTDTRHAANWLVPVAIFAITAAVFVSLGFKTQPLDPLSLTLARIGKPDTMPPPAAEFFKIPAESVSIKEVRLSSEDGDHRSAQLLTATGDIFFIHQPSGDSRMYFFRTNRRGRPMLACSIDSDLQLHPVDDAQSSFDKEKDFWLTFQAELSKHEAK
jgi:hypothetical protein